MQKYDMILHGGRIYTPKGFQKADIAIHDGRIAFICDRFTDSASKRIVCENLTILPGFADVHVHLREPGFSYKETIGSGTAAAARGGYTALCSMPNLNPPPDTPPHLGEQQRLLEANARVRVYPYGCLTMGQRGGGELADLPALHAAGAVAFSDDGRGIQREADMRAAMELAAKHNLLIAAHCEDEGLLKPGGCVHEGEYARAHGLAGISSQSEWGQVERDLRLAEETGCRYHVCHISTKESVGLVRRAKARGVRVTCETAPHYLLLCDQDLQDEGRFKMNPPLRALADRAALMEGLRDGTIDMIATDHAPHSAEEKSKGLAGSLMGVVGLETAFAVLYTRLVQPGVLPLERLVELLAVRPREVFGLPGGRLEEGQPADITLLDINKSYTINPESFLSQGRATPFGGWSVTGEIKMTMVNGRFVYGSV